MKKFLLSVVSSLMLLTPTLAAPYPKVDQKNVICNTPEFSLAFVAKNNAYNPWSGLTPESPTFAAYTIYVTPDARWFLFGIVRTEHTGAHVGDWCLLSWGNRSIEYKVPRERVLRPIDQTASPPKFSLDDVRKRIYDPKTNKIFTPHDE